MEVVLESQPRLLVEPAPGPRAMNTGLVLSALECARGERVLFRGVGAVVRPGQLLRVVGPNGSGKTTLLRAICGLVPPDRGDVLWRGQPIAGQREAFHQQLVYLGHAVGLKDNLSAVENLVAASGLAGIACSDHDAAQALSQAGLHDCEWLPVRMLSQGQRRRVALARLALQPTALAGLWVLDEPFNTLDDEAAVWLIGLITRQLSRGGVVVLTSHQPVALGDGVTQVTVTLGDGAGQGAVE